MTATNPAADVRTYPLVLQDFDLDWQHDNRVMAWWSKGHHSFDAMHEACGREYGRFWENIPRSAMRVTHHWWRVVPRRGLHWDSELIEAEPGSRGAFPATSLEVDDV